MSVFSLFETISIMFFQEQKTSNLKELIKEKPPNYIKIVDCHDFSSFLVLQDQDLFNFLAVPENIEAIINGVFDFDDNKIVKKIVDYITKDDSPFLDYLIQNKEFTAKFIQRINSGVVIKITAISAIFSKALKFRYSEIKKTFGENIDVLVTLVKWMHTPIYGVIKAYDSQAKNNEIWFPILFLKLLTRKENTVKIEIPSYLTDCSNLINGTYEALSKFQFTEAHYIKMLTYLRSGYKDKDENENENRLPNDELNNLIITNACLIYNLHETQKLRIALLKLCLYMPTMTNEFKEILIQLVKKQVPYNELSVEALKLLSIKPDATLVETLPVIIDRFIDNKINSLHNLAFVTFIKKAILVNELRDIFIQKLTKVILNGVQRKKWRENSIYVGYYFDIAYILDEYIGDQNQEWNLIRENELKEWISFEGYVQFEPEEEYDYYNSDGFYVEENDDDCFVIVGNEQNNSSNDEFCFEDDDDCFVVVETEQNNSTSNNETQNDNNECSFTEKTEETETIDNECSFTQETDTKPTIDYISLFSQYRGPSYSDITNITFTLSHFSKNFTRKLSLFSKI